MRDFRRFCTCLCIAGASSIGFAGGYSKTEIADLVQKSRQALPDMTGTVTETVTVTGEPTALPPHTFSWGDRNGKRSFTSAYKNGQIYFSTKDFFGGTATQGLPVFHQDEVTKDGKQYINLVNQRQGSIRPIRTAIFTPLSAGYWLEGQPLDQRIRNADHVSITPSASGNIEVVFTLDSGVVTCTLDPKQGYQIVHSASKNNSGETVKSTDVLSSQSIKGQSIPTDVVVKTLAGSARLPTSTSYKVSNLTAQTDAALFQPKWEDGTRVSDDITGNVYLVSHNELTLDPLFSQKARDRKMKAGLTFMAATVLLLIIGATALTKRLRR